MQKQDNYFPLVSIPVITYNSSQTVLDTLESIKFQTYKNLELILSDDASRDDTVSICKEWIEKNRSRFIRVLLIEGKSNVGISANANRALSSCEGEWVKGIAGDDILFPDCISRFVEYVCKHQSAVYVFAKIKAFGGSKRDIKLYEDRFNNVFFSVPREEQYQLLLRGICPPAPTAFYHREKVKELGVLNDERIPFMEDLPKWVSLYRKGVSFDFLDEYVVNYRLGGISTTKAWFDYLGYKNLRLFYFYYVFEEKYKEDPIKAVEEVVDYEVRTMKQLRESKSFRIGDAILKPLRIVKRWLK